MIEVIIFMVIIGVAAGAMLAVFARTSQGSAELLANRQALAIAEALLNEVLAEPFTYCDPRPADANFSSAMSPLDCASPAAREVLPGGPEAGEARTGLTPFDNVNDYNGFTVPLGAGITDRAGSPIPGSAGYRIRVTVAQIPGVGTWNGMLRADMALVTVTMTGRLLRSPVTVEGMRSRFAPNTLPP